MTLEEKTECITHDDAASTGTIKSERTIMQNLFSGPVVHVIVEPEEHNFTIHKSLLCHRSQYYADMIDRGSRHGYYENADAHIEIREHEVDVEVFRMFTEWLYTQRISIPGDDVESISEEENKVWMHNLVKLWVYAERIELPSLQNIAILALDDARTAHEYVPFSLSEYVLQKSRIQVSEHKSSMMLRWLVAAYIWSTHIGNLDAAELLVCQNPLITHMLMRECFELRDAYYTGVSGSWESAFQQTNDIEQFLLPI